MGSKQKYIHNHAGNLIRQLHVDWWKYQSTTKESLASRIWNEFGTAVKKAVYQWKDETLGAIVASGLGEHDTSGNYKLHDIVQTLPSSKSSGRGILIEVAAMTIVAAMADIIWSDVRREAAANSFVEPKSPYGFWATRHGGM